MVDITVSSQQMHKQGGSCKFDFHYITYQMSTNEIGFELLVFMPKGKVAHLHWM